MTELTNRSSRPTAEQTMREDEMPSPIFPSSMGHANGSNGVHSYEHQTQEENDEEVMLIRNTTQFPTVKIKDDSDETPNQNLWPLVYNALRQWLLRGGLQTIRKIIWYAIGIVVILLIYERAVYDSHEREYMQNASYAAEYNQAMTQNSVDNQGGGSLYASFDSNANANPPPPKVDPPAPQGAPEGSGGNPPDRQGPPEGSGGNPPDRQGSPEGSGGNPPDQGQGSGDNAPVRRDDQAARENNPSDKPPAKSNGFPTTPDGKLILVDPDGHKAAREIDLPDILEKNLANVDEPLKPTDVPIFLHLGRSAGTTMKTFGASCLGVNMVTEVGAQGHENDETLQVIDKERPRGKFVNVDASTVPGLEKAKKLNLGSSGLAGMVVTSFFLHVSDVFDPDHRGRMFILLRHPVERISSMFHVASQYDEEVKQMDLVEFSNSQKCGQDQLTRILTGARGPLTDEHLAAAKQILRKKFLIGLLNRTRDSFYRFERFFKWTFDSIDNRVCAERFIAWDWAARTSHPPVTDADIWHEVEKSNRFDVQLFEYSVKLYKEQWKLFY